MKRKLILAALIVFLAVSSFLVVRAGGANTYDLQSLGLLYVRLNVWFLMVTLYFPLMAALGDDDLEKDYDRINKGNMAVAAYRVGELAVVGIASAVLIAKV